MPYPNAYDFGPVDLLDEDPDAASAVFRADLKNLLSLFFVVGLVIVTAAVVIAGLLVVAAVLL